MKKEKKKREKKREVKKEPLVLQHKSKGSLVATGMSGAFFAINLKTNGLF